MSDTPVVYLAGPVAAAEDGGAGWRNEVIDRYGDKFEFRNPLSKYNVKVEELEIVPGESSPEHDDTVGVKEIVETDKQLLRESDAVLVGYSAVRSIGTPMEVMWAYERDMPVVLWVRDWTGLDAISPWYRYHATIEFGNLPSKALLRIDDELQRQEAGADAE